MSRRANWRQHRNERKEVLVVFCEQLVSHLVDDCANVVDWWLSNVVDRRLSKAMNTEFRNSKTNEQTVDCLKSILRDRYFFLGDDAKFGFVIALKKRLTREKITPRVQLYIAIYNFVPGAPKNLLPFWLKGVYTFIRKYDKIPIPINLLARTYQPKRGNLRKNKNAKMPVVVGRL